jgi:hypothetical protein
MEMTAKDLVEVTLGLIGKDGRTFPTQREIRRACGDVGSFKRMDQALLTVQVARGALQPGQASLDKDFAAVLAAMEVPTPAPTFDGVTGIPEEALAKFREGVLLFAVHVERWQSEILRRRTVEQMSGDASAKHLRQQVDDLTDALDESGRSARETEQRHMAEVSGLREQTGVLTKEVEFLRDARSNAERRITHLESELKDARAAHAAEVEKRHAAEKRVASLEAENGVRDAMAQKGSAPTPDIPPRPERKPNAA